MRKTNNNLQKTNFLVNWRLLLIKILFGNVYLRYEKYDVIFRNYVHG